ncbi:hypothetical protein [Sphingobium sp. CAP-1]|nr:hypothetical protein [Sphingobium sp. CAP-1]
MSLFHSLIQRWRALRVAARQEFLRDPTVILFERSGEPIVRRESVHG